MFRGIRRRACAAVLYGGLIAGIPAVPVYAGATPMD